MGLLNKKPTKKTTINKLIQESKEKDRTIEEVKQERPQTYAESVYNEFQDKYRIISQQKDIVYQKFQKEFEDFTVYLDPIRDKDIVDQLDEIRNYQNKTNTFDNELIDLENEVPKEETEKWKDSGSQSSTDGTIDDNQDDSQQTNETNIDGVSSSSNDEVVLNPYAIYYEDYIQQEKIRENMVNEYDVLTKKNIDNNKQTGYYGDRIDRESDDGKQDLDNLKQSFQPDFERCVDSLTWTEKFMWQLIMGEHKNTDLVYWLNKYVLGPQESLLNVFVKTLRGIGLNWSVKVWKWSIGIKWYPFDWISYFDFAEQFQYNSQNIYKSKVCKTPYFPKNYTGSREGKNKFLKSKNDAMTRMIFSSSGSNIPSTFNSSFYKRKTQENEQIYNTLIAHYLQEGFKHDVLNSQSKLVKYKNKTSISIPEDIIIAQGESNLSGTLEDDFKKLNTFLRKFFKIPSNMYLPDQDWKEETKHILEQITLFRQQSQEFYPLKPEYSSIGQKYLYRMVRGERPKNNSSNNKEEESKPTKPKYENDINSYTMNQLIEPQRKIENKYRQTATKDESNRKHFLARDTQNMMKKAFEGLLR